MIFNLNKATERVGDTETQISFSSLEEFLNWVKTQEYPVIITSPLSDGPFRLEIYDGYIE